MPYKATKTCAECGKKFEAASPRAKFCKTPGCRKAASRRPSKRGAKEAADPAPSGVYSQGALLGQTISDLTAAGVLETIPGRSAVALAYRIESPMETGSAAASMTRELSRLVEEAKTLQSKSIDPLDELKNLRDRKRTG